MYDRNRQMVDQVEHVYKAVSAHRDAFYNAKEVIARECESPLREHILEKMTTPTVSCVLIFKKGEEILPETMAFIERLGLTLTECSSEEKSYRDISPNLDAYALYGKLAY